VKQTEWACNIKKPDCLRVFHMAAALRSGVPYDLRQTLEEPDTLHSFRTFLRTKLDGNKSTNSDTKKKFEQWLDFVLICQQIFSLAEDELDHRIGLMGEVGERFLAKPPLGYNIALANQLNRRELELHCKNLKEKVSLDPDTSLLRPGYEFIFSSLSKKHDVFKRTTRPSTTLQAILCSLS